MSRIFDFELYEYKYVGELSRQELLAQAGTLLEPGSSVNYVQHGGVTYIGVPVPVDHPNFELINEPELNESEEASNGV